MGCPAWPPPCLPRPVQAAVGGYMSKALIQQPSPLALAAPDSLGTSLARGGNFGYLITFDGSFLHDFFLPAF